LSTDVDRIRQYYARFAEWERLDSASGALELRRARALLRTHLQPGSRILDLGGGPGRYAIDLARAGHRVTLADLSPVLLEDARRRLAEVGALEVIESIDEVDARDLRRYQDQRFDAVVAFGPFYHLIDADERTAAVREIARVLQPDGVVFAAFIPRLSGLAGLLERAALHPEQVPPGTLSAAAQTGIFRNGSDAGFQEGHFADPFEFRRLFEASGFVVEELVSLRSTADRLEAALDRLEGSLHDEMEQVLDRVSRDPAVVATAGHAVLVGRKPR